MKLALENSHIGTAIKLPNGYVVSIQHSKRHYCTDNTVEVAVIYKGKFIENFPFESGGVAGHITAPQLITIIDWARER